MGKIEFYLISEEYLDFLRKTIKCIPQKEGRSYIAVKIKIVGVDYYLPMTSKVISSTGKKRNPQTTTFIKNLRNEKIACLLHNNLIPATDNLVEIIKIEEHKDYEYFIDEHIYIKREIESIQEKANKVYYLRINNKIPFWDEFCCDFKLAEQNLIEYNKLLEENLK